MITSPRIYCPLCGRTATVVNTLCVKRYTGQVVYLCVCSCGQSEMTVDHGKILSFELRDPEKHPPFRVIAG